MINTKLKVGFSFDPFSKKEAPDGKHQFLIRLANQMKKSGVIIDNKKPDIYLRLPGEKINKKAKLNVLRVDGLIMNIRWDHKSYNKKIKKSINNSDALVYQSKFCEEAYRKFLNITNIPFDIIFNGADHNEFLPRKPKNFFLANSRWRPHKRLKEIIKCFEKALEMGLDADLIVTGDPKKKYKHPRIKYVGWKSRSGLKKLMSRSIASMHLTWLDWCPNSMVEAIVSRCPVIYTKCGGQIDLGRGSGIGIEDNQWKFDIIDLYDPPKLDIEEVANAMIYMKKNKDKNLYLKRDDLDIQFVSKKYVEFFNKLMRR
jgi:glycosyltransferase involved in cell wall biosynthesis